MTRMTAVAFFFAALIVSLTAAEVGVAEEAPKYARTGPYVGAGFLYAIENFDTSESDVGFSNSLGAEVRAGYRLHPNVAAELAFQYYEEFESDEHWGQTATVDGWYTGANVKGYPLTGRFQPYALLGAGVTHMEGDSEIVSTEGTGFTVRFGGGLDVYVTDHVVVNVEAGYLLPTGDVDGVDIIPIVVGAQYRF